MPSAKEGQRQTKSPAPVRDFLKEISTAIESRPSAGVIYGPAGAGKSSTCAHSISPVIQPFAAENTWALLKQSGAVPADVAVLPPADTWTEVLAALDQLIDGKHNYKTYVLDTLACAERLCHEHVCNRDFGGGLVRSRLYGFPPGVRRIAGGLEDAPGATRSTPGCSRYGDPPGRSRDGEDPA